MSTDGMTNAPDALIRLENLRRVCEERGLGAKDLSKLHGRSYAYWYTLLSGKKHFGEKAARSIEYDLQLPDRWLDQPHDGEPTEPPADRLSAADRALLADLHELPPEEQESWRAQVHERAAEMRRITAFVLERAMRAPDADTAAYSPSRQLREAVARSRASVRQPDPTRIVVTARRAVLQRSKGTKK